MNKYNTSIHLLSIMADHFSLSIAFFGGSLAFLAWAYPTYALACIILGLLYFFYLALTCCGECGWGKCLFPWCEKFACGCPSCIGLHKPGMLITSILTGSGWSHFSGIEKDVIVPIFFFMCFLFAVIGIFCFIAELFIYCVCKNNRNESSIEIV